MLGSQRLSAMLAMKQLNGHVSTVCWHTVLLKLKLILCFHLYKEYENVGHIQE